MIIWLPTDNMLAGIDRPHGWMIFKKRVRCNAVSLKM